jgi:hypothetical protein
MFKKLSKVTITILKTCTKFQEDTCSTAKPVNKGHPRTWPLFTSGLYLEVFFSFLLNESLSKSGLYTHDVLYLEVVFNTG